VFTGYSKDELRSILDGFAEGWEPEVVFGTFREHAAWQIAGALRAIMPTRQHQLEHALLPGQPHAPRLAAYRVGYEFVVSAYHEYGDLKASLRPWWAEAPCELTDAGVYSNM